MPLYTSQGIVYTIKLHRSARRDLEEIDGDDPDAADDLYALLQEIRGSQELLDALTVKDFGLNRDQPFHVDKWVEQQNKGRNLWRIKSWDLENRGLRYRIVYALDPRCSRYYVLAVLPRDVDYDSSHPRVIELTAAYDRLGIPAFE